MKKLISSIKKWWLKHNACEKCNKNLAVACGYCGNCINQEFKNVESNNDHAKLERIREIVGHLQPVGKFGEIQKILNQ